MILKIKKVFKTLSTVLIWIAILFAVSIITMLWFHNKALNFCDQITPNMPLKSLLVLIENEGVQIRMGNSSRAMEISKIILPDPSTIGEMACVIDHDGNTVISAKYK
jgi:hypothetical protein